MKKACTYTHGIGSLISRLPVRLNLKKTLILAMVSLAGYFSLNYSTGPANSGQAVSGAPFDGGATCTNCHSAGTSYAATLSIELLDGTTPVTSYTAGNSYTLRITRSANATYNAMVDAGFGFQLTCATGAGYTNNDDWGTLPSNTADIFTAGRNYIEHSQKLSKTITQLDFPWTAPTSATAGDAKFYIALNTVNGDGMNANDEVLNDSLIIAAPIVCPTPSVSVSASATSICDGNNVTFTATPTNGGSNPTYQWLLNGTSIVGETNSTYATNALIDNDAVKVVMTPTVPCNISSATSNTITVSVAANVNPSVSIAASATSICAGATVSFTSSATNGGNNPTYQWMLNGNAISGATNDSYSSNALANGDVISLEMTTSVACYAMPTATSNGVTMTVTNNVLPTISISASTNSICAGTSVSFASSISNGGNSPSYQWMKNGNNISGATGSSYSSTALANGDVISCELTTSVACYSSQTVTSNAVSMVVNNSSNNVTNAAACNSYTWSENNQTYTQSGVYTFQTTCGTDTLKLTINKPNNSLKYVSATDSYLWNGTNYTKSGIYSSHFTNSNGCDSTATINLTIFNSNSCFQQIHCSFAGTFGIKNNGTLWDWGRNSVGQLGDGTTISKSVPIMIGNDSNWTKVSSNSHTMAIKKDGTLWVWGWNVLGQLGDNTTTNKLSPIQIGSDTNWASICPGVFHSLAIKTNGTLWAWGANTRGQLGNGSNTSSNIPIQIGNANDWAKVSAGNVSSVAIKTDGTLWAWGYNFNGELGNGTNLDSNIPVQIGTATNWASVHSGQHHILAIKTDGTLWAWGYNGNGELGDSTTTSRNTPVQVGTDNDWVIAETGLSHSIALKSNGTIWTWGLNSSGQLGNNSTTDVHYPIQVGNATNWRAISAGGLFNLAVKIDGTFWLWGKNDNGQLGDGSTVNKLIPTAIACPTCSPTFATINATACGSYSWNGSTLTSSGVYYDTLVNSASCDSFLTLNLTIKQPSISTTSVTTCGNYSWNGTTYTSSGIYTTTLTNSVGCDSVATLNLTINQASGTISGGPLALCNGGHVTLTAGTGSNYSWSNNATTQTINAFSAGTYTVTYTDNNGCTVTASQTVVAKSLPTSLSISVNGSTTVCEPNTVLYTVGTSAATLSGFNYQWNLNGTPINGATDTIYNASSGSGNVTLTISGSTCSKNSNSKMYTVKPKPTASFSAGGPTTFCTGSSVTLNAPVISGYTYSWLNNGAAIGGGNSKVIKTSGNYSVIAKLSGCADTAANTITVTVNALPIASVVNMTSATFCNGDSCVMQAYPSGGNSYQWMNGTSVAATTSASTYAAYITGSYKVIVTDANNCTSKTSTTSVKTKNIPLPVASITALGSTTISATGSVKLNASPSMGVAWQWYKDGNAISGATAKQYTATTGGSYTVAITKSGCTGISSATVVTQTGNKEIEGLVSDEGINMTAYPNPVTDALTITINGLNEDIDGSLEVVNTLGQVIQSSKLKIQNALTTYQLSTINWPSGNYFIRYKNDEGKTAFLKITKE